jgi:integrase
MARPVARKGTDNPSYRQRIPEDVKRILDQLPRAFRPKGWGKSEIWISAGTNDKRKAQAELARIRAEVETYCARLRDGVRTLTQKEAVALAGTIYRAFADSLEDNPGTTDKWATMLVGNAIARAGKAGLGPLLIGKEAKRRASMETHFGPLVDATLARECLLIDDDSRVKLLEEIARALDQAFLKLQRNAEGDYRPDEGACRFPAWVGNVAASTTSDRKLTLSDLFRQWAQHPEQAGQAPRTVSRYRGVFDALSSFLENPDVKKVTTDDVARYLEARMTGGMSPRTAKDVQRAALNSVFNWAIGKRILSANPAKGHQIKVSKPKRVREKGLTDLEAQSLTKACLAIPEASRQGTLEAARRWLPLIALYTGARRGEVAQLRKRDVVLKPTPHFRLTPEAGTIKTGEFRDVPIHSRLVELGFLSFVDGAKDGPLFYNPANRRNTKASTPQAELVGTSVVAWLKEGTLSDPNLKMPLHAIRHRFITCARRVPIEEQYIDAIDGHSSGKQGRSYGEFGLEVLQREIERLKSSLIEGCRVTS